MSMNGWMDFEWMNRLNRSWFIHLLIQNSFIKHYRIVALHHCRIIYLLLRRKISGMFHIFLRNADFTVSIVDELRLIYRVLCALPKSLFYINNKQATLEPFLSYLTPKSKNYLMIFV